MIKYTLNENINIIASKKTVQDPNKTQQYTTCMHHPWDVVCDRTIAPVPDSKIHGADMGPTWGRQDPGGSHVGPMNLGIRGVSEVD